MDRTLIAVLAIALLLAGCAGNQGSGMQNTTTGQPAPQQAPQGGGTAQPAAPAPAPSQTNATARTKLSDTQFWSSAYLISGDTLDDNAKAALAGFGYNRTAMPDGSTNITLTALEPQYQGGSFLVKPGENLYFIETSFGDDSGNGEYNMGDDMAVLVDSDGYVVQ